MKYIYYILLLWLLFMLKIKMRATQRDDLCKRHHDSQGSQNRWDLLLGLGKSNNKYAPHLPDISMAGIGLYSLYVFSNFTAV